MHWLVVRGGALGDFVLTLPAIEGVRAMARRVTLACDPRFAALRPDLFDEARDLGGTDALWLFGGGPAPRPLPEAALVYTPTVAQTLGRLGVAVVLSAAPRPLPGVHARDHLWAPLADRAPGPPPDPRVSVDADAVAAIRGRLRDARPVVLAPGAASPAKQWPHFPEVAAGLTAAGVAYVWMLGRDEPPPRDLRGPVLPDLDLGQVAALASTCAAWLGNDTGTTHLAAAAGAPTLALFGPTDPAQWAPVGARILPFAVSPKSVLARIFFTSANSCPPGMVRPMGMD